MATPEHDIVQQGMIDIRARLAAVGAKAGVALTAEELVLYEAFAELMLNGLTGAALDLSDQLYRQYYAALTHPISEAALATARNLAFQQAVEQITNLTMAELNKVGSVIADGLKAGLHPTAIARNLDMVVALDTNRAAQYLKFQDYLDTLDISPAEYERRLEAMYQKLLKERRETIAITESRKATGQARKAKGEERGAEFKIWIADGPRPCAACQANAADGAISVKASFSGGADVEPQHPICHCNVIYVMDARLAKALGEESRAYAAEKEAA